MLAARRSVSAVDLLASTEPSTAASTFLPAHSPQNQDDFKWTSRYLASNAHMQQVANTLLELMSLPPHPSLHAGKTTISISSECDHDRISGLEGLASSSMDNHFKTQWVHVKSTMGWSYEFNLRPSCDLALYDKYNVAEYLQVWPMTQGQH
ncbi:hypothetical protein COO60DRAFT_405200 [Scenedesmus sp. NREL 46B-D3]|nr:hypothetical protein COO60DRAFT_405200 [Scenedesmus sp. NREL 46B-D3]